MLSSAHFIWERRKYTDLAGMWQIGRACLYVTIPRYLEFCFWDGDNSSLLFCAHSVGRGRAMKLDTFPPLLLKR